MLIEISKSKILKQAYNKSKPQNSDANYNFYSLIERFANHVIPQLTQINLLFDEYTPHDQIHMQSLFRIADDLLGSEIINNLNGCEACLLVCTIYGHDWGMAVSEDEKRIIITGNIDSSSEKNAFALLKDEQNLWKKYTSQKKIICNENGYVNDVSQVPIELWRNYVRQTHAERAKARIIKFFNTDDSSFAKTLGEICAAHWYSVNNINLLPKNKLVLGETVNVQALGTYIRFIDLLDIGKNRTPYSLWKFINPKNNFSANEWKKHISLEPVSIKNNHSKEKSKRSLEIIVQGSTESHIVYTSLKDMRNWIEEQIKENEQILKELGAYSLGDIKVIWEIEADGFDPIDIRFEFDRSKMFNLISGEIYNGDPYVFLRELLQNSIDATKIREIQYKEKGVTIDIEKLIIKVDVKNQKDGNSQIIFRDSGIGMNLNTIRNYLAVIGKSYYRSADFNNLDFKINPISRFGVGLISCFEIADKISIQTKLDNYIYGETDDIKIEIEHYNQQFRVEKLYKNSINTGTSVCVNVLGDKWRKDKFEDCDFMKITDYLKLIAGFVPYPILINENENELLIFSADFDSSTMERIEKKFPKASTWKGNLNHFLEDAVINEDLSNSKKIYTEKTRVISENIGGSIISGSISYFIPNKTLIGITRRVAGSMNGVTAYALNENSIEILPIRYKVQNTTNVDISDSAKISKFNNLYLNGILIPIINENLLKFEISNYMPPSKTIININPSKESNILPDLARKEIRNSDKVLNNILKLLFENELKSIFKEFEIELIDSNLCKRIFLLSNIDLYIPKYDFKISDFYPLSNWPIPYITKSGSIEWHEFKTIPEEIEILSTKFMQDRINLGESWNIENYFLKNFEDAHVFFKNGADKIYVTDFGFEYDDGSPMNWNSINSLLNHEVLNGNFTFFGIRICILNGENYILEKWKKGKSDSLQASENLSYSIRFIFFNKELDNVFCVLPLENSQLHTNLASKMYFNLNHSMSLILERVLKIYHKNILKLNETAKEKLTTAFQLNPLVGYGSRNYSGNLLQIQISAWAINFCNKMEEEKLINFSSNERKIFNQKLIIITSFE